MLARRAAAARSVVAVAQSLPSCSSCVSWACNAPASCTRRNQSSLAMLTNIIDKEDSMSAIMAHDKYGFTVNNIHMRGSVLVFRNFSLLWNVQRIVDVTPRNIAIAHMISPRPELLIIGVGEKPANINPSLFAYFSRKGISVEPMTTPHAIATFNTLNQEGRRVAAALISRSPMAWDDACLYTPEAVESEADLRLKKVLARDYSAADAVRLIEGATAEAPDRAKATAALRAVVRVSRARQLDEESQTLAVKYGYPGALPADISLVDTEAAAAASAGTSKPRTMEEYEDARARRGSRRSAADRNKPE